ncbi:hypothetical protein KM043_011855 [Ampulex compressa]|nr:hypothetical protein KM043_011855 [Ampulex compressa]
MTPIDYFRWIFIISNSDSAHKMDFVSTFNCNGRVNYHDWQLNEEGLFLQGEVERVLFPQDSYPFHCADIKLFNHVLPAATVILNLKHFVKCLDMQLKILCRYESYTHSLNSEKNENIDYYSIRTMVCEFIVYIRTYLNSIKANFESLRVINAEIEKDFESLFITIKKFLGRLRNIPDATFHYVASNVGNKSKQPEFHLYHMHIELRWLFISLLYIRNIYWQYATEDETDDLQHIQRTVINDLLYISLKIFEMSSSTDLKQRTPYNCTCIRELWLMLQIFIDSLADRQKSKTFWDYVNICMDQLLSKTSVEDKQPFWCEGIDCSLSCSRNPELFCIWMICHLSLLYGYNADGVYLQFNCSRIRPNNEQLEKILKTYICKGGKDGQRDEIDEELTLMIPLLHSLLVNWWQPRVSVISLLWDCFHKRLDQPFLLQTSGPWTLSVDKKTPMDILKQIKSRLDDYSEYVKESSYGLFLRLLGTFLKKYYSKSDTKHWNQIKSRIFSKYSKSKIQELSLTGLYNFLSLFITLAITADTINVCSVLLNLLPSIKELNIENDKKTNLIWKGKLVVLLLYNEFKLNISSIACSFTDMVNTISCCKNDNSRAMMINFVDVLSITFSSSVEMDLEEHLLIGGWIDRYLLECPRNKLGTLIKMLIDIFEKCLALKTLNTNLDGVEKMLDALWSYVACRVRQLVFDPIITSDHYQDLSKLAVMFTLEALRDPVTAKKHKHSAVSLFQHFAASIIVKDVRITRHYLVLILQDPQVIQKMKNEVKNFDTILVQAWIKCSILGYGTNEDETEILRDYVLQLNEIREILLRSHDLQEFQTSNESILIFIMCSMKKRNLLRTEQERLQYDTRWRQYFSHIEKWVLTPITDDVKESELSFWIYRCIGTLILCCSSILYVKNQPNNMLKALLNKAVLSSEHSSQLYIKSFGKKIFSMVLLGIETLNYRSDITLQVLIRDLFEQYMPLLITDINSITNYKVSDSLLKCFRDAKMDFMRLIFEMLTSNFLLISSDNNMHKHSYLVMLLLRNLLKGGQNYASHIIDFIITICTPNIFGCYMKIHDHHPHKQHTIDFISNIMSNPYYKENGTTREKLNNEISSIVQKYLSVSPQQTFELLRSISIIRVDIIKSLTPQITQILFDLEKNRRPTVASLRYSWTQLQEFVQKLEENI